MSGRKGSLRIGQKPSKSAQLLSYGVSFLSVALALGITLSLRSLLSDTPAQLFFVAVMVSAWYGGLGPGLLAAVLSTLTVNYFFIEPYSSLNITNLKTVVQVTVFMISTVLISGLNEARHIAIRREQTSRAVSEAAQGEAQAAKERLEKVLSSINDGFYVLDRHWCFTYVNDRLCEIAGMRREQLLGHNIWDLFPDAVDTDIYVQLHRAIAEQTPSQVEYFYAAWNRWYDHRIYPSPNGLTVFITDTTKAKHDESVRKQSEEELRQSEERFQAFMDHSPAAAWITDRDGRILYLSQTYFRTFQFPTQDVIGKTVFDIYSADIAEQFLDNIREAADTHEVVETHEIAPRLDGTMGDFLVYKFPIADKSGEILVGGVAVDITGRKQIEETLRQREIELRLLTNTVPALISFIDSDQRYRFNNQTYETWFGHAANENYGKHMREVLGEAAYERIRSYVEQVLTGETVTFESQVPYRNGGTRHVSATYVPRFDAQGTVMGFVAFVNDISDRKLASERLNLLYETTRDLLATDQPMQLMNNLFSKLSAQLELHFYYNYMVEEKDNQQMLHLRNYEGISEEVAQSIEWINFGQYLCGLVARDRQQKVFDQAQISTHPNAQLICSAGVTAYAGQPLIVRGRLLGTLSFASRTRASFTLEEIDLLQSTCEQIAIALERMNLMNSIQQQAEQLKQANRVKDEFLAVLSHELRSPLNPILGWSKLLQSGKLDEAKTAQALATIERNAKLQSELIEDLLDVSRILQGKLSLNVSSVDLASTIKAAIETVRLAAEVQSIQVVANVDSYPCYVTGDPTRLQQIMWNLLSNAVKFTPKGGRVEIQLNHTEDRAQVTVHDTGKGIAPDFIPYLFDYFRQEDGATTRRFGGLGLGLAIVHHLVELHGGTIQADSPGEGLGATFIVRLPLLKTENRVPKNEKGSLSSSPFIPHALHDVRVLVIDDEPDSREFVTFVLEQAGAMVMTTSSAQEGFVTLTHFKPDLLLSDIGMPDMDGYMLMRQVRALPETQGGTIPAIALTAYAGDFNQQQALAAGFQQHMAKPVDPIHLVKAIANLTQQKQ